MHDRPDDERRRYFRIQDDVYLELREADEAEYDPRRHPGDTDNPCDLLLQLRALSSRAAPLLAGIRKTHPELGHFLAIQEKRVDLLAQNLLGQQIGEALAPNAHVDLSAGGVGFSHPGPLPVGALLRLRLVLFPHHLCIQSHARVVHCDPAAEHSGQPYRVGAEFVGISETARDALVRHTLERQSAQRRQRRE